MIDSLGKTYMPGEVIVAQGDVGDCMFVIQEGEAEVLHEENGVAMVVDTMKKIISRNAISASDALGTSGNVLFFLAIPQFI